MEAMLRARRQEDLYKNSLGASSFNLGADDIRLLRRCCKGGMLLFGKLIGKRWAESAPYGVAGGNALQQRLYDSLPCSGAILV